VKQSHFEGSHRQKRAEVVRLLLAAREKGATADDIASSLSRIEESAGREAVELSYVEALLGELAKEGFCSETNGRWHT
jgi:A/G-specific adenine glycosylase